MSEVKANISKTNPKDQNEQEANNGQNKENEIICPDCGAPLRHAEGCVMCPFCGWSKCG